MNKIFEAHKGKPIRFPKGFFKTKEDICSVTGLENKDDYNLWFRCILANNETKDICLTYLNNDLFRWDTSFDSSKVIDYEGRDLGEL